MLSISTELKGAEADQTGLSTKNDIKTHFGVRGKAWNNQHFYDSSSGHQKIPLELRNVILVTCVGMFDQCSDYLGSGVAADANQHQTLTKAWLEISRLVLDCIS